MMGELQKNLGFLGDSKSCKEILQGIYHPPFNMDIYTVAFLSSLYKPVHLINEPTANLSTSIFTTGWKKMKKATSAGSSGVHFRYMKVYSSS